MAQKKMSGFRLRQPLPPSTYVYRTLSVGVLRLKIEGLVQSGFIVLTTCGVFQNVAFCLWFALLHAWVSNGA